MNNNLHCHRTRVVRQKSEEHVDSTPQSPLPIALDHDQISLSPIFDLNCGLVGIC
eukprot:m.99268 g.99268  ORF g.99268 m.99268 type:complete len:55 (-) comp14898_c3_seq1:1573-1737(-)